MTRNVKAPPGAHRAGPEDKRRQAAMSVSSLSEQARQLVEEADCEPPCDLVTWTRGYLAGWDAAWHAGVQHRMLELAETMAEHDRKAWAELGPGVRERRIRREIAEMEAAAARIHREVYGEAA